MALQTLGVGQESWFPAYPLSALPTFSAPTYVMDASGEYTALVLRAPRAGTIDKFGAFISAVANAPDNGLRFSLQGVDLATGLPDTGVDQFATVASGSVTTGFLDPGAFDTNRTVTRNELFACVLDFPTFVAGDSVTVQSLSLAGSVSGFPYGVSVTGTKNALAIPQIYLHYTDSGGIWVPASLWIMPYSSITSSSIDTGTTPDEVGLAFTLNSKRTLDRVVSALTMGSTSNFDLVLYNAASSVITTASHDGDVAQVAGAARAYELLLEAASEISPSTLYRLIAKPSTLANIALSYGVVPAALFGTAAPGAGQFYMTQRTDAGAWTDFNNVTDGYRIPIMYLGFSHHDDGVSSGGANRALLPAGLSALG